MAYEILQALKGTDVETLLVMSDSAKLTMASETDHRSMVCERR
jgi:3-polyprenyl-4-hydroxybenzoate decarboxylase